MMKSSEETLSVIRQVFAAFDEHDLEAFQALLSEDAVLIVAGGPQQFVGPEAIVEAVGVTLDALPDLRVKVVNAFAHGAHGVVEAVRHGTNTGPVHLPGAEHPPTGRRVRLPECVTFEVRDGRVVRMAPYADQLDAMRQFGLLPKIPDEAVI